MWLETQAVEWEKTARSQGMFFKSSTYFNLSAMFLQYKT